MDARVEPMPEQVDLDGRWFGPVATSPAGEVDDRTEFLYHQDGDMIWARYSGGLVRLGNLVGTRDGDTLQFRYCHLNTDGETASGRCTSLLSVQADGRLRLDETWVWESREGEGVSSLVELDRPAVTRLR